MFTGIIETVGSVKDLISIGTNKTLWIESPLSSTFKTDQSVSHSGVCLTVEEIQGNMHRVTAIEETISKTNLGEWKTGDLINLERCLLPDSRIDGHFVQGHVDTTGLCMKKKEKKGSWEFEIQFPKRFAPFIIEKGSICLDGISLTAFNVKKRSFRVAVIPYTYEHSNIHKLEEGFTVNLEFDLLGKYILRRLSLKANN